MYSAFLLYAFWLDSDGNLQANCIFRILSVKMWGKKQRKWPLVEMQHAKEYEELKFKFHYLEINRALSLDNISQNWKSHLI